MIRNVRQTSFIGVTIVGLFLFNGVSVLAQQELAQRSIVPDEVLNIDGPSNIKDKQIEFDSGGIELFSDGTIRIHGVDYFLGGQEPCYDMEKNRIDMESLGEGDIVTINYVAVDRTVVSVQLEEKHSGRDKDGDFGEQPKARKANNKEVIRLENGTYIN